MVLLSLAKEELYIIIDALSLMERQKKHTQNTIRVVRAVLGKTQKALKSPPKRRF